MSAWAKFPVFRKKWPVSRSEGFHIVQIGNHRLKIDPCAQFQPDWTKDKGSSNFDLERKLLMTSYLPHSDDVSKIINDFERFCSRVRSCQVCW